jgi:predicted nuclease of predicted toxin-antitoxin system
VAERIKFYTDEHVLRAVVRGLRERGIDTLTVSEAGMLGAGDEEHLLFARREGLVLFT